MKSEATSMPIEGLLFEFGRSGDMDMLKNHYAGRASKKQAFAYCAIAPKGRVIEPLAATHDQICIMNHPVCGQTRHDVACCAIVAKFLANKAGRN